MLKIIFSLQRFIIYLKLQWTLLVKIIVLINFNRKYLFFRKLKLYEEQELTMQVFCDIENKEMPINQDNMVVNILFCFFIAMYVVLLHIIPSDSFNISYSF